MTQHISRLSIFTLLAVFLWALPSWAQPALTFEPTPTVRGLAAGARIAWVGLGRVSVDSASE